MSQMLTFNDFWGEGTYDGYGRGDKYDDCYEGSGHGEGHLNYYGSGWRGWGEGGGKGESGSLEGADRHKDLFILLTDDDDPKGYCT